MSSPLWRRRAHLATEAMIVAAMPLFGVCLASHLVNNALAPIFIEGPGGEDSPDGDRIRKALLHVYRHEARSRERGECKGVLAAEKLPAFGPSDDLFIELQAIWQRSHAGHFVTPDSLDRLVAMVDRSDGRSLRSRRARGFWSVEVVSTVGVEELVIAQGAHPMYAVAAELCRSSLAD